MIQMVNVITNLRGDSVLHEAPNQRPNVLRKHRRTRRGAVLGIAAFILGGATMASAQTVTLDKNLTVTGQGSTFLSNFVDQCKADVKNELGINISYQPTGSGAGRSAYLNGTNDFAGSDVAFSSAELSKAKPFIYVPIAIGGIAVIYNIPGVTDLKLSASSLAKIFSGQILKWNDGAIKAENPKATLPGDVIKVVVRSDSSGTSNVFSDYLLQAGKGAWPKGVTNTFPVPEGNGIAQKGSDGVSNYVAGDQGKFAITYAEQSFAEERKLSVAKIINESGNAVTLTPEGVSEAISTATVNADNTLTLNFNPPGTAAYPISTASYLIAPQTLDKAKGDVLRTFLTYALMGCQTKITKIGYAPIPKAIETLGLTSIAKINPGSGAVPTIAGSASAPAAAVTTTKAATSQATSTTPATTPATSVKPSATPGQTTVKPVTKAKPLPKKKPVKK
jgi:phosphate transport system substrate-binding protein